MEEIRGWLLLARYSEIALKGKSSRRRMEGLLVKAIKDALKSHGFHGKKIEVREARIWVHGFESEEEALEAGKRVARVMGVVSVSPVKGFLHGGLNDIVELGRKFFSDRVKGKTFAVRARRVGEHDFTSKDVEVRLGEALLEEGASRVDLENPEYTAYVEVRWGEVYFYDKIIRGPGGLPIGSEGRVLALFSGGIDSPVAAWLMLKRGCMVDYVFFNIGGEPHVKKMLPVAKVLADYWSYGYYPKLYIVDIRPVTLLLSEKTPEHLRTIMLRRIMKRVASIIAEKTGAKALVTGESLGQVASQTLQNIVVIDQASPTTVLRPLIGFDKQEIVELARIIGTYEYSIRLEEYCALNVRKPTTRANIREVLEAEKQLGELDNVIKIITDNAEIVDLRRLDMKVREPEPKIIGLQHIVLGENRG